MGLQAGQDMMVNGGILVNQEETTEPLKKP